MSNPSSGHDYVLGNAETEQKRLVLQASILRGWTEKFFVAAGLKPGMRVAGPGSYIYSWIAETLRSLLPRIEQHGLTTADELQIDTLASRLEAEAVKLKCQLAGPMQIGAWVTVA